MCKFNLNISFSYTASICTKLRARCKTPSLCVAQLLEDSGGMTLGGKQHGGSKTSDSVYHATQHHLLDFISQTSVSSQQVRASSGASDVALSAHNMTVVIDIYI